MFIFIYASLLPCLNTSEIMLMYDAALSCADVHARV